MDSGLISLETLHLGPGAYIGILRFHETVVLRRLLQGLTVAGSPLAAIPHSTKYFASTLSDYYSCCFYLLSASANFRTSWRWQFVYYEAPVGRLANLPSFN